MVKHAIVDPPLPGQRNVKRPRFSDFMRGIIANYLDTHRHNDPSFIIRWERNRPLLLRDYPILPNEHLDAIFAEMVHRMECGVDHAASIMEGKKEKVFNIGSGTWS